MPPRHLSYLQACIPFSTWYSDNFPDSLRFSLLFLESISCFAIQPWGFLSTWPFSSHHPPLWIYPLVTRSSISSFRFWIGFFLVIFHSSSHKTFSHQITVHLFKYACRLLIHALLPILQLSQTYSKPDIWMEYSYIGKTQDFPRYPFRFCFNCQLPLFHPIPPWWEDNKTLSQSLCHLHCLAAWTSYLMHTKEFLSLAFFGHQLKVCKNGIFICFWGTVCIPKRRGSQGLVSSWMWK